MPLNNEGEALDDDFIDSDFEVKPDDELPPLVAEILKEADGLDEDTIAIRKLLRKNQNFKKAIMFALSTAGDVLSAGGVPFAGTAADLLVLGIKEVSQ